MLACALPVAVGTVLIGLTSGSALSVAVLLQPLVLQGFWPAALIGLGRLSPPRTRSLLVAFTVPAVSISGAGLVPAWWGRLGDAGRFADGFVIVGVAVLVLAVVGFAARVGDSHREVWPMRRRATQSAV